VKPAPVDNLAQLAAAVGVELLELDVLEDDFSEALLDDSELLVVDPLDEELFEDESRLSVR
jgi:hypothetical protein